MDEHSLKMSVLPFGMCFAYDKCPPFKVSDAGRTVVREHNLTDLIGLECERSLSWRDDSIGSAGAGAFRTLARCVAVVQSV